MSKFDPALSIIIASESKDDDNTTENASFDHVEKDDELQLRMHGSPRHDSMTRLPSTPTLGTKKSKKLQRNGSFVGRIKSFLASPRHFNNPPKHIPTWEPAYEFSFPIIQLPVLDPIPPGDLRFASFTEVRHLTDGSNADIYLARWRGDQVIIKMIKEEKQDCSVAIREFNQEHGILARISHHNIIKVLGSGTDPRRFIVLEYLECGTLKNLLQKNQTARLPRTLFGNTSSFTYMELLNHAVEIAEAFDYIHRRCHYDAIILHRDLKPDNIGIRANGRFVLIDFGLATAIYGNKHSDEVYEMTGFTGSARYMAPEVALNAPYNERADVYSYGILLWQMASDQIPYAKLSLDQFLQNVVKNGERPKIDERWPKNFQNIIRKCIEQDPKNRCSFSWIISELKELINVDQKAAHKMTRTSVNKFERNKSFFAQVVGL